MERRERLEKKTGEWMRYAQEELAAAKTLLGSAAPFPRGVAFHAQQGAEMAVKAWLIHRDADFPHTHDMRRLLALCPEAPWVQDLAAAETLTRFATTARYASAEPAPSIDEATGALEIAEKVLTRIRHELASEGVAF